MSDEKLILDIACSCLTVILMAMILVSGNLLLFVPIVACLIVLSVD
jgi:hypothetical protein